MVLWYVKNVTYLRTALISFIYLDDYILQWEKAEAPLRVWFIQYVYSINMCDSVHVFVGDYYVLLLCITVVMRGL